MHKRTKNYYKTGRRRMYLSVSGKKDGVLYIAPFVIHDAMQPVC